MNYTPTARQLAQAADLRNSPSKSHPYVLTGEALIVGWFPTQQGARVRAHQLGLKQYAIGKLEQSSQPAYGSPAYIAEQRRLNGHCF